LSLWVLLPRRNKRQAKRLLDTLSLQLVVPGEAKKLLSEAPLSQQQLYVILYIPCMEFGVGGDGGGHSHLGNGQM